MHVEFFFDGMCPWAYQTSVWMREIRQRHDVQITWRLFSLEEINLVAGKKHPWEREISYGWTPLRIAAWLRRIDMDLCDAWYAAAGRALHVEGRLPHQQDVAVELLAEIGAPPNAWDAALADPTTHDDVRADHDEAVSRWGGFGVPMLVFPWGRAVYGPVVAPAPTGADADALWDLTVAYAKVPHLYELKTPKTDADLAHIGRTFDPYLANRTWNTVQNPAR